MTSWEEARLDWLVTEERATVDVARLGSETVFHYSIPVFDELGDGQVESVEQIGSAKLRLRGGEVLISRLNPRLPRVLLAEAHAVPTVASTEFIALRPGGGLDNRYLRYWLGCDATRQFLAGARMSVTRSQQRIRPDVLTKCWVHVPPRLEQTAIADFLDAETASIDALITNKELLINALRERMWHSRSWAVLGGPKATSHHPVLGRIHPGWSVRRVKHVVRRVGVGVVVNPSSYFADSGAPFIHGSDVRDGWIDTSNVKRISETDSSALWRSQLAAGDVVLVRAGYPGRAAVVPPELAGGNCASILILKRGDLVRPEFLAAFFISGAAPSQVEAFQYGAAQEQINVGHVVDFVMPVPPLDEQEAIMLRLQEEEAHARQVERHLRQQLELLRERRQALITAAVTGDLN